MFALIRKSPLALVVGPWSVIPSTVEFNGVRVHGASVGYENGNYLIVDVVIAGNQPTEHHTLSGQSYSLNGNELTVTRTWQAPSLASVKTILKDRLNSLATIEWINCRGTKAAQIETANTNGASSIDAAGTIAAAIAAYNAVTWP